MARNDAKAQIVSVSESDAAAGSEPTAEFDDLNSSEGGAERAADIEAARAIAVSHGAIPGELTPATLAAFGQLLAERNALVHEIRHKDERIMQLERLADEDPLMPILNRRAFLRELRRLVSYARRYEISAALLYFDINGMKEINDTYGHAAGDAAIRHVVNMLCQNVRSADVVGRLGGDEFAVLLANTGPPGAEKRARALVDSINGSQFRFGERDLTVQTAVGVVPFDGTSDPDTILNAADAEMYADKQASKKRLGSA